MCESSRIIVPGHPPRLLVLDREADDPRWMLATIALPSDIMPATLDPLGRYTGWTDEVCPWVTAQVGQGVLIVPATAGRAWHVIPERTAQ